MAFDLRARAMDARPNSAAAWLRGLTPFVACIVLAIVMQTLVKPNVGAYSAKLILEIGINVVLAVSLNIVNGLTGQFSMGHAGFLAVGGYAAGIVTYYGSMRGFGSASMAGGMLSGMPIRVPEGLSWFTQGDALFGVSLLVGGLVSALMGLLVGLPSLRLRGDYLAIVTLGFGEIVRVMITITPTKVITSAADAAATPAWKLPGYVGGSLGFNGLPGYTSLFWVYLVVAVTLLVAIRIKRSTFGRAFLSIREDEVASEAMGVATTRFKVRAFVLAAFFAGVAGGLFAHTLGVSLTPQAAGFQKSFDIIIMVVLGGLGSISGATIAAVVVTLLPEYLRAINEFRMIVFALALILMMVFRPQGLLGVRELWDRALWEKPRKWLKIGGSRVGGGTNG